MTTKLQIYYNNNHTSALQASKQETMKSDEEFNMNSESNFFFIVDHFTKYSIYIQFPLKTMVLSWFCHETGYISPHVCVLSGQLVSSASVNFDLSSV